jgi:hypothetical protein
MVTTKSKSEYLDTRKRQYPTFQDKVDAFASTTGALNAINDLILRGLGVFEFASLELEIDELKFAAQEFLNNV